MARNKVEIDAPWVGYIRVSTDDQASTGLGLKDQEERIRGAAAMKAVPLVEIITDAAESAKSLNRPGVQRLIEMVKGRSISGFIIAKIDRLTRSVRDLGDLTEMCQRCDVAFISAAESFDTTSANGRLMLNLIGMLAQWEREVIAERTSAALQVKLRRGEHAGNVAYGYQTSGLKKDKGDGLAVPNEAEQAIIREMLKLRGDGKTYYRDRLTYRQIADKLNAAGFRTRRGSEWRVQYVAEVLKASHTRDSRES